MLQPCVKRQRWQDFLFLWTNIMQTFIMKRNRKKILMQLRRRQRLRHLQQHRQLWHLQRQQHQRQRRYRHHMLQSSLSIQRSPLQMIMWMFVRNRIQIPRSLESCMKDAQQRYCLIRMAGLRLSPVRWQVTLRVNIWQQVLKHRSLLLSMVNIMRR